MTEKQEESSRKHYSAEQKYKIVKEALTSDQTVSEVCLKYGVSSAMFYRWQEQFLSGARDALEPGNGSKGLTSKEQREIERLKADNLRMKDVIAEVAAENIDLKKKNLG